MYKCYICGKEYKDVVEAALCTLDCNKELQKKRNVEHLQELSYLITDKYTELKELCKEYSKLDSEIDVDVVLKKRIKVKTLPRAINNTNTVNSKNPLVWNGAISLFDL